MAAMDVLIMPWNDSEWIQACNPIKLKEYLAVGRPVVTTDFPALGRYRDLVSVAKGPRDFAAAIRRALDEPYDAEKARARVASESWDAKASYPRRTTRVPRSRSRGGRGRRRLCRPSGRVTDVPN